jgi:hypothetical protein
MTFTDLAAARAAAARFDAEYGQGCYCYRFEQERKGYSVRVYSIHSGAFLAYV